MNLHILFSAPLAIQIHVYAAVLAAIIGAMVLWRRKGTVTHRRWGKIWVVLMAVTSLTSFFIHEIQLVGPFSPIHLISIAVLFTLYFGVKQAKSGDISKHQRSMKSTYIGGIGVAGALTFLPSRMMYKITLEPTVERLFGHTGDIALFNNPWFFPVLLVLIFLSVFLLKVAKAKLQSK